jgi:hypothetical protein
MSYSNPYADPPRPYPQYNDSSTSLPAADYPLHNTAYNNNTAHGPPSAYPYAMTPDDQSVDQYDMGYAGHLQGKGRHDGGNMDEEEKAPLTAQYQAYPPGTPGS